MSEQGIQGRGADGGVGATPSVQIAILSSHNMGELARGSFFVEPAEGFLRAYVSKPEEIVSTLISERAATERTEEEAATELKAWITMQEKIVNDLTAAPDDESRKKIKKRIPAIVPGRFVGTNRIGKECLGRQVIMHDFDAVPAATFDGACEQIRAQLPDRFLAIHTTATERNADGTWRLRVAEILDREATPDEWEQRVKPHMKSLGEHDPNALDLVRFLFMPVRTAGYEWKVYDGPRTRLDDLRAAEGATTSAVPSDRARSPAVASSSVVRKAAAASLGTAWPAEGRHPAQLALAGALCREGWDADVALEFLCDVCRIAGDEDRRKRTGTIRDVYRRAATGGTTYGWTELQKHVELTIVSGVRDMLDKDAAAKASFRLAMDGREAAPSPSATSEHDGPIPFDDAGTLPAFPVSALPPDLRAFAVAEAEATQTPVDLAGLLVIGACAAAVAGKVDVLVEPGWAEGLNLFIVIALPPGERKSAVFKATFDPLFDAEKTKAAKAAPTIAMKKAQRELTEQSLKKRRSEYAKLTGETLTHSVDGARGADLARLIEEESAALEKMVVPAPPRLTADDITMEKLAVLLGEQNGRMCCASAEGALFGIASGRYSKNGQESFEVLLKGHAGDSLRVDRVGHRVDRVGHEGAGIYVSRPRLSLVYSIQPHIVQSLGASANMRGQGLLARFLYSFPASMVGSRSVNVAPVPDKIRRRYHELVKGLADLPTPEERQALAPLAGDDIPVIELSPEAREIHRAFRESLEPRLHPQTGDLATMGDWANKLAGAVARIAGVLHVAEHGQTGAISEPTMRAALALGEYAMAHAAKAFGVMLSSPVEEDARALLNWITSSNVAKFKRRDVQRNGPKGFRGGSRGLDRLSAAAGELIARGYVRREGEEWVVL